MTATQKDLHRVLCVDDDPQVVAAIMLHLRRHYQVATALGGIEGLKILQQMGGAAVVISDMRMPGMDGATFLHNVMHLYPDASRILLTGETGRDAAVAAVNKGHIFQFLTKPCTPDALKTAIEAGIVKYRLANTERSILQQTLNGCLETLMDVLALTRPSAFGRVSRLKLLVMELAAALGCEGHWQLEAAALLLQIGHCSLPTGLVEKLYSGTRLTPQETIRAGSAPLSVSELLKNIPRLEPVAQILAALTWTDEQIARLGDSTLGLHTRILSIVLEYDTLVSQGHTLDVALQVLRSRSARFGAGVVEQFGTCIAARPGKYERREIPLGAIKLGMIFTQDVRTPGGTLLIAHGSKVTDVFLQHTQAFEPDQLNTPVRVLAPLHPERED